MNFLDLQWIAIPNEWDVRDSHSDAFFWILTIMINNYIQISSTVLQAEQYELEYLRNFDTSLKAFSWISLNFVYLCVWFLW